jgi:hypothetical protein
MSRYFRFLLLSLLAFTLLAAPAFAGTLQVNVGGTANTPYGAAIEAMGAARNVTIVGAVNPQLINKGAVAFTLGGTLSSTETIVVGLSGAAFTGDTIILCAANGAAGANGTIIGSFVTTAGNTSQLFPLNITADANVAAANQIYLSSSTNLSGFAGPNSTGCANAGPDVFPIQLAKSSAPGTATVSFTVTSAGGSTVETSTANIAIYGSELAATLSTADTITIDYLGSPGTGVKLAAFGGGTGNSTTASSNNKLAIATTRQMLDAFGLSNTTQPLGGVNAAGAANLTITISDSASWAGINSVYMMAASSNIGAANTNVGVCDISGAVNKNNAPAGNVVMPISTTAASNGFNPNGLSGGNYWNGELCVNVSGAVLQTRAISGAYTINVDSKSNATVSATSAPWQNWGLNGYQALLPWLTETGTFGVNTSGAATYCLVNNSGTSAATMMFNVLATDNSTSVTGLSLGSLPGNTSRLLIFDANGVEVADSTNTVIANPQTAATLANFGSSVGKRYVGQLTVATPQNNVSMACQQTDAVTGAKRLLPVLVNNANAYSWPF